MAAVKGFSVRFRRKRLFSIYLPNVFLYAFLILVVAFAALPLIYVISSAFKPLDELFLYPPKFFVRRPTLENFGDLFSAFNNTDVPLTRNIFNSLFVTIVVVILTVVFSGMAAFALVKQKPKGSSFIFTLILTALMFSPHVTQIPNYVIVKNLNMINTYWSLILPKIAVAYNVFLMKQFLEQMPDALLEASRLDGANEWQIFCKIVMPYLRPAWGTLVVFSFVSNWNDYFSPLVFTNREAMKTLPLAVQSIAGGPGAAALSTMGAMAASTLLMTLPTILVYTLMQGRVLKTMGYSGIKS